ncbi:regulator of volume decrease after cellular swelling-domain-containing protein [Dimargaris cristalligena]|uniref:Regulator of volume decrease after cellular swelling-domain-containing protein n=1 Tax=Dimargaris cristalligena TaxID=215637 RepID=A0A4P9ZXF6_9FUNG|nr:regulator of volume decrease after cellular swelling-domain-containing protein [Dimargaris cristalligena]|eukprot:RKP38058.1 regulator of volume decrease after cellular swelling-domain-containing protein [Dimargaris cristalligena]
MARLIKALPALTTPEQPDRAGQVLRLQVPHITCTVSPALTCGPLGEGSLYVAESQLIFYSETSKCGLALPYPSIILHGVVRPSNTPSPSGADTTPAAAAGHLYCQIDRPIFDGSFMPPTNTTTAASTTNGGEVGSKQSRSRGGDELASESDEESDDGSATGEVDEPLGSEVHFRPADAGQLRRIFDCVSECAALHPSGDNSAAESDGAESDGSDTEFDEGVFDPNQIVM